MSFNQGMQMAQQAARQAQEAHRMQLQSQRQADWHRDALRRRTPGRLGWFGRLVQTVVGLAFFAFVGWVAITVILPVALAHNG